MDTILYFASPAEMRTELEKIKVRRKNNELSYRDICCIGNNIIIKGLTNDPRFSLIDYHYDQVIKINSYNNAYERLIVDNYPSDITVIVNDRHFHLHNIILNLTTDYFRCKSDQFPDTDPHLFEKLVHLIYGNYVPIRCIQDLRLLSLIRKFKIYEVNIDAIIANFIQPPSSKLKEFIEVINFIYPEKWTSEIQIYVDHLIDSYNDEMLGSDFFKDIVPLLPSDIQSSYKIKLYKIFLYK